MATGTIQNPLYANTIAKNADLDTFMSTGVYRSPLAVSDVGTLTHCPTSVPFVMVVSGSGSVTGCVQMIATSGSMFTRRGQSSGFGSWYKFEGTVVS